MTRRRPLVIVTRKLPDQIETRMMELFECRLNLDDHPFSQAELVHAMAQAEILVPTVTDNIDAGLINGAGADL
jgi:glyoxylate reductase